MSKDRVGSHKVPIGEAAAVPAPVQPLDYVTLFQQAPGLFLVLDPGLKIVAVTDGYLRATKTQREEIVGRTLFEVFPDNPTDETATGVANLRASLERVLQLRRPDAMAVQKYDIPKPEEEGGGFEERFWSPVNSPVLDADGRLAYIIHRVEDVTDLVKANLVSAEQARRTRQLEDEVLRSAGEFETLAALLNREKAALERYQVLVNTIGGVVWEGNAQEARCLYVSPAAEKRFGHASEVWFRQDFWSRHVHSDDLPLLSQRGLALEAGNDVALEFRIVDADGRWIWVRDLVTVLDQKRRLLGGLLIDISAAKRAEEELRQAQKMESIGVLAGGVAHDFNNILGVIMGQAGLAEFDLPAGDPMRQRLELIVQSAQRAAALTGQLLAFSRQQVLEPRLLDLNEVVSETEKMLVRIIGEDIELVTRLAPDLGAVKADPGKLQQVIMNLAVNARDAMPQGGQLTLETANVEIDEPYIAMRSGLQRGPYAMLTVSDTGCGMSPEIVARIFEPFFTTKHVGKGTGLGLATVHGIVKQSGGDIWVYSEPGMGTTFRVYLPRVLNAKPQPALIKPQPTFRQGTETVLLAEDQPAYREVIAEILEKNGYTVLQASTPTAALQLAAHRPIDLLLTDVIMPEMSGVQLAIAIREKHPGVKVVFMSGYTDDAVNRHGISEVGAAFLQKPFGPRELSLRIRETLDAGERA